MRAIARTTSGSVPVPENFTEMNPGAYGSRDRIELGCRTDTSAKAPATMLVAPALQPTRPTGVGVGGGGVGPMPPPPPPPPPPPAHAAASEASVATAAIATRTLRSGRRGLIRSHLF